MTNKVDMVHRKVTVSTSLKSTLVMYHVFVV